MAHFLFPKPDSSKGYSLLLLALRIFFGLMLMAHGLNKFANYLEFSYAFPDPTGLGKELTLVFVIIAELCCSIALLIGFLHRIFIIPMILVMGGAFFYAHGGSIANGELAFIYLVILILMFITGPGKYSFDAMIYKHLSRKEDSYEY